METLLLAYYHFAAVLLLLIGFYIMIMSPNLIKKVLGLNIMETAVFLFFISVGKLPGAGRAPILLEGIDPWEFVNPVPQHMVILGVLITLGVTGFSLVLIIRIFQYYGTLNCNKLRRML